MASRNITFPVILMMTLILSIGLLAGFLTAWHREPWYLLLILPAPLAAFLVMNTYNQSTRQIAFFFEAIRNEDSALKFPTEIRSRYLRQLYQSLNDLNRRIQEIKLQNEYLEKYYQSFIQHAATGLVAISGTQEIEMMNEKAFDYAGVPSFTPLHLVPLRNSDFYHALCQAAPGETITYKRLTGDSQINLLIRVREIRYGGKSTRLISLQDIRHELDEKELESWQKLIRVLTHEIMNSIAPIVSLTGTLRKFFFSGSGTVKPEEMEAEVIESVIQGLDTIEERGNGLLKFVNSYRRLTRIPKPEFTVIPVREWMEQVRTLLQNQFDTHRIRVEFNMDPLVKEISGDEKLLTQVMINIFNNAIEALQERKENRQIVLFIGNSRQNKTLIRISNNGPPISSEIAEKIFIPFFTTKEHGSGIGLSLSRQILRLHNGSIHLEPGKNETVFVITW